MSEGRPLHADRAVWNATDFGGEHAIGIRDSVLQRHNPQPGAFGNIPHSDGTDWQLVDGDVRYVFRTHWLQNGFLDAGEAALTWTDATRTLRIAPTVTSFHYLAQGIYYTKSGNHDIQIANTAGLWIFYWSANTLTAVHDPGQGEIDNIHLLRAVIAYVYWDATVDNEDGRLIYDIHGANQAPATHAYLHDNFRAIYGTGMALADFVIDDSGDDAEDAQFSIASGKFDDEDLQFTLAAINKTTGIEIWYLDGANWRWQTNAGYSILTTGTGRMAWNDGGAQAEVGNTQFALCHIFGTSIGDDAGANPKYIAIQGQAIYATKKLARAGAETEINALVYGTLPIQEVVPVGTVIFQSANGYGNAVKSRTVSTDAGDNYVDWRKSGMTPNGSIVGHTHDHNTGLFGHQGGSASERYHLTAAQHTALGAVAGQVNTLIWIGW